MHNETMACDCLADRLHGIFQRGVCPVCARPRNLGARSHDAQSAARRSGDCIGAAVRSVFPGESAGVGPDKNRSGDSAYPAGVCAVLCAAVERHSARRAAAAAADAGNPMSRVGRACGRLSGRLWLD